MVHILSVHHPCLSRDVGDGHVRECSTLVCWLSQVTICCQVDTCNDSAPADWVMVEHDSKPRSCTSSDISLCTVGALPAQLWLDMPSAPPFIMYIMFLVHSWELLDHSRIFSTYFLTGSLYIKGLKQKKVSTHLHICTFLEVYWMLSLNHFSS